MLNGWSLSGVAGKFTPSLRVRVSLARWARACILTCILTYIYFIYKSYYTFLYPSCRGHTKEKEQLQVVYKYRRTKTWKSFFRDLPSVVSHEP